MKISVIVPTYRRPDDLVRCLSALAKQRRTADEIVLVVRDTDTVTRTTLADTPLSFLPLHVITVSVPGVIAAMNAGLEVASGEIICFTDDDAAPHPDWLERIEVCFQANSHVGGVGGRDLIQREDLALERAQSVVGQLQWFGRIVGNHHLGFGDARNVDILKGVNMSYRRAAIGDLRFDPRMLGSGAQVHFEVAFSLTLKRKGWQLIYDPNILVDHYVAQRFSEDQRNQFNSLAYSNAVHNETVALLDHLSPLSRFVFGLWSIFIGTRQALGFLQWVRLFPRSGSIATQQLLASWQGRQRGWVTWYGSKTLASDCSQDSQYSQSI
ncbi:MAG: glycosyltransferase family 2 protein [Cyanothece sp. SIO1E1]|nr:glycosyltransferase family 2 protein [Cyanothece sp. SIO1E1]